MLLCALGFGSEQPAHAIMGDEADLVRSYFRNPERWTPDKQARMKKYAAIRTELRPTRWHIYANDEGIVEREIWVSASPAWSLQDAIKIRDAIMQKHQLAGQFSPEMDKLVYMYRDGSYVIFSVGLSGIYRIMAISSSLKPMEPAGMPPALRRMIKLRPVREP